MAPVFTMGQIVFLIAFVVYIAAAVMALFMDFDACLQKNKLKSLLLYKMTSYHKYTRALTFEFFLFFLFMMA